MRIVKFIIDSIVAYLWAIILLIPIFNVFVLRTLMEDSRHMRKRKK